jgi:hypothetical protein
MRHHRVSTCSLVLGRALSHRQGLDGIDTYSGTRLDLTIARAAARAAYPGWRPSQASRCRTGDGCRTRDGLLGYRRRPGG